MAMDRNSFWFRTIYAKTVEIKQSELNLTMDWTSLQSFKEHLRSLPSLKHVAGDTVDGIVMMAAEFMQEPEYIQLSADYIKEVKEKGDFKDKLEKELEEKRGVSKTKSGKQKL